MVAVLIGCTYGLCQQAIGARRFPNIDIHSREPERLLGVSARSEPEFGCMVGESLRVICDQLVITRGGQPAPMPGFMTAAGFTENARELRRVIRIIRRARK